MFVCFSEFQNNTTELRKEEGGGGANIQKHFNADGINLDWMVVFVSRHSEINSFRSSKCKPTKGHDWQVKARSMARYSCQTGIVWFIAHGIKQQKKIVIIASDIHIATT